MNSVCPVDRVSPLKIRIWCSFYRAFEHPMPLTLFEYLACKSFAQNLSTASCVVHLMNAEDNIMKTAESVNLVHQWKRNCKNG